MRFISDSLRFTGTDLSRGSGGETSRVRRGHAYHDEEGDETSDEYDSEQDSEAERRDPAQKALRDKEEALIESALARIRRAQDKGKKEVKLNKEELAALERRRKRLQDEERRKRKDRDRIAVPLAALESSTSSLRQRAAISQPPEDNLPRHPSPGTFNETQRAGYPPMGYFPPPSASRSRPRSGTASSSRPQSRGSHPSRGSSPFRYSYVQHPGQPPANYRHVSDTGPRPRSTHMPLPHEEAWVPNPYSHPPAAVSAPSIPPTDRHTPDPFDYMTGGSPAPYHAGSGAAASRRHVSGPAGGGPAHYHGAPPGPAAARAGSRRPVSRADTTSDTTSETGEEEEDDDTSTSDDVDGQGARVNSQSGPSNPHRASVGSGGRRDDVIVVEDSPSPERRHREPSRGREASAHRPKKSTSPVKRKPVGGGGGGGGSGSGNGHESSGRRRKGRRG